MAVKNKHCIIIGAGIVGLATALRLQERWPHATISVIEKESAPAAHQSGHNSGVIHAGVYYEPGSLKARLCRTGLDQTIKFCREHGIAVERCGKLIVAVGSRECSRLKDLFQRAQRNGVECDYLDETVLRDLEPNIRGDAAIRVGATAIVDYRRVCRKMAEIIAARGATILFDTEVMGIEESTSKVRIITRDGSVPGERLIVCAGLQSDRLAQLCGLSIDFAIVPFRGDFFRLPAARANVASHLIYPVPDPTLPFLGVHLTRTIDGGMTVGPSAMLAFDREAYSKRALSMRDTGSMLRFSGFWRLLMRYPTAGLRESYHALSRRAYLRAVTKYCPSLTLADLVQHECGIRAQAVGRGRPFNP